MYHFSIQGFWMGLLTTSGSLARVVGPVFVSFIYQEFGTWALFGIVTASLGLSFVITTLAYRQLVPFDRIIRDQSLVEQIKFWKGWTGIWQEEGNDNANEFHSDKHDDDVHLPE